MIISVFGSSNPQPTEPAYQEGLKLGKVLAEEGFGVQTGGYMGTMEAVSRGAAEAGGLVTGVTCEEIEKWRPNKANQWVQKELRLKTVQERLDYLVRECDAAIALPGGPGTLAEISLTWTLMQTESMAIKPLILVGLEWQSVFSKFLDSNKAYISEKSKKLLFFANDPITAIKLLLNLISVGSKG